MAEEKRGTRGGKKTKGIKRRRGKDNENMERRKESGVC